MSKMKNAKISKVHLPFLLFGHKEYDWLWKLNKNNSDSQNHRTAEVGDSSRSGDCQVLKATVGCPDLYSVSIQEYDPLDLHMLHTTPGSWLEST